MNTTAIAIVAIVTWGIVSIVKMSKKTAAPKFNADINEETAAEIARLKERIETLEKIVTDESYDLKKQFKDLESGRVA